MKKFLSFALIASLFLVACGPKDTFTVYEIKDCSDYFDYLNMDVDSPEDRQAGIVYGLECTGVVDYQEDVQFAYGFLIDTEEYGQQRIGLHITTDEVQEGKSYDDPDLALRPFNGQEVEVSGDLWIQFPDANGASFYAEEEDIKVIPAF